MTKYIPVMCALFFLLILSCDDNAAGPNDLGGDTSLELTKVGNETGVYVAIEGANNKLLQSVKDTLVIVKSDNGIVTTKGSFTFDSTVVMYLDTLLGTSNLTVDQKKTIIDTYLKQYGATLDSMDKQNIRVGIEIKAKITSEGIQGFRHSNGNISKPFTVVKYNSNVGDKYAFTDDKGVQHVRTVIQKDVTETWSMGYLQVKTIRVEEVIDDPVFSKIIYIANHKFGLVGAILTMKSGKDVKISLVPWSVL